MRKYKSILTIIMFLMLGVSVQGSTLTADDILKKVDAHRLIGDDFEMMIRVNNYLNNHLKDSAVMTGYVENGKIDSLIFQEPSKIKGRKILIKSNDMWLIIPNVKNPIRITASQRLIGGISYGDVAAISYEQNYVAKLDGEETVAGINFEGIKSGLSKCFILKLTAKVTDVNYSKITIWVEKESFFPVKADFFALSGKRMTTVYYTAPKEIAGKNVITKMFLFDQVTTSKHFSMEYYNVKFN